MKAMGAPLLHAIGIEAFYSFIKENLHWTLNCFKNKEVLMFTVFIAV